MIFLFTEIDHPRVFQEKGTPEADHILACQYFLIEEILSTHGVHWMQRTPTGVLAAFQSGQPIVGPEGLPTYLSEPLAASPSSPLETAASPEGRGGSQFSSGPANPSRGPAEAAIELQKEFQSHIWGSFGKAQIRMALHAGEADPTGQTYVGPEFNHTLKLLQAARSGQVLLTVPAVHFTPLPPGARLKDMGKHFLKDLSVPDNLYALLYPGLELEGARQPLSLNDYPQNFFPQASPFFGREEEMGEITGFLADPSMRLVILVGPGGYGKTRLAFQAAAEVIERFKDGVFLVTLSPLLSIQLLVGSIASTLKIFLYGVEDAKTQFLKQLQDKKMLLVLDNFEHLMEGSDLVEEILAKCPGVKILITSRESLGVKEEKVIEVTGLRYPESEDTPELEASSAVQLFIRSVRRIQPQFTLEPENRRPLLAICRLLEGMPLGLELSATWVGTLSLPQIAEKISNSQDFLATSMPHLPPRHRSMRAVFEYSWILLSAPQKKSLRALSVFRGGFTALAARRVAGASEELLAYLVRKSLLRKRESRYEIHELLKFYAKEKLFDEPAEKQKAMDSHCLFFSQWVQAKEKDLTGPNQKRALEEMEAEMGNIQEGWRRAVEHGKERELENFRGSLFNLLETKGAFQEGRETFQMAVLSLRRKYPSPALIPRASALLLGWLLCRWGNFEKELGNIVRARELFAESLEQFKAASASQHSGFALEGLGHVSETEGDFAAAKSFYEKSLGAFRLIHDRQAAALVLNRLGNIAYLKGNIKAAQSLIRRSLANSEQAKDQRSIGFSYMLLGDTCYSSGQAEYAKDYYQKALDAYLESGDRRGMGWAFTCMGRAVELQGDYGGARQMYQEGLIISRDLGDIRGLAWRDTLLGNLDWAVGDYEEAGKLYEESLSFYRQIGDRRGEAWVLEQMGNLQLARREDYEAESLFRNAYELLNREGLNRRNKAWHAFHLGMISVFREEWVEARKKFKEALACFQKLKDDLGRIASLQQLEGTSLSLGKLVAARTYLRQAVVLALKSRLTVFLPDLAVGIARLRKAESDDRQAMSFLFLALSHPTCRRQTKDFIITFSRGLESHFPEEEVQGARQWALGARLEDVVGAWVAFRKKNPVSKLKRPHSITRKVGSGHRIGRSRKKR